jgi:hypothetical protein
VKRANCPSCGAEVLFRSAVSILAVCDYCRSTLLRKDLSLENLGKMAELLEDASPVQLGTEGRYQGISFTVIGRIQLRHAAGLWNEWHLLYRNGHTGWLGETPGLCAVSALAPPPEDCPAFDELEVGRHLSLQGRDFQVVNLERVRCIAGEGELPFRVGAGYDSAVADLHGAGQTFATLDYSESPPLLFIGEQTGFDALSLTNLRDVAVRGKTAQAETFRCKNCGVPLSPKAEASVVIVCASCGSAHDLQDRKHPVLFQAELDRGPRPLIPLGTRGRFRGKDYEVIGFMQRVTRVDWVDYHWREYLLMNLGGGFDWLSEYQGHWNFIQPATHQPAFFGGYAQYQQRRLRHFQDGNAQVDFVLGEFYWRVTLGENARLRDFVDPPWILSEERTGTELLHSFGEYIPGDEVRTAFKIDAAFPEPTGVYANQPSPWQGRVGGYWWRFGVLAALVLALQIGLTAISGSPEAVRATVQLDRSQPEATQTTPPFDLKGVGPVSIEMNTNVANNWVDLSVALVDVDHGTVYTGEREVSFYQGYDDGYWSEGSTSAELSFAGVPDGRYYLAVSAEGDAQSAAWTSVTCNLAVRRARASWGNFFLALLALATWPGLVTWRHHAFETRRWMESDHPPTS